MTSVIATLQTLVCVLLYYLYTVMQKNICFCTKYKYSFSKIIFDPSFRVTLISRRLKAFCSWAPVGIKCSEDEMRTKLLRKFPMSMHYTTLSPEHLVYIINVYNNPSKLFLMLPNNCPLTVGADLELE